jgi:hypothetical protein
MLLLALLLADALGAPACKPLDEAGLRSLVFDAQSAIDRGDRAMNTQLVVEILDRVPCLQFVPSPREWSDFLVELAIARFAEQGDWQTPLGAALRLRPGIDRGVAAGHPMAEWTPPPAEPGTIPVPPGDPVYVDGTLAADLPPVHGMFLVQRVHGESVASRLVVDEPVPADWLTERLRTPRTLVLDTVAALTLAGSAGLQRPRHSSTYVTRDDWFGVPLPGAVLRLTATWGGASATGELGMGLRTAPGVDAVVLRPGLLEANVLARADVGPLPPVIGVGLAPVPTVVGDPSVRRVADVEIPWAFAGLGRRESAWEAGGRLGGSPGFVRAELRGARVSRRDVWGGLVLGGWWATLEQTGVGRPSRTHETGLSLVVEVGVAGGPR